ncbi:protein NTM1-like 9 isoform X2 [Humulus lupulus]|uniref:protein NTM1-like 9 isoform X2 n=1 Tax=Humulus lupulus TaxID=3486 RepID=UPI002B40162E|nr:protein NTM1-like 9 isoform X2 [Humulus lupulus]
MSDYVPVWVRPPCPFFKFKPTEEELITHLNLKTLGKESDLDSYIAEVDHICKWQPWELPHFSKIESKTEWWFLCRPDYKNSHSNRSNRTTKTGYWKKTGRECNTKGCDGRKRILVFHDGSSSGKRTDWVLHEYYSLQPNVAFSLQKPDYVICRLKRKHQEKGQNECEMASDLGNPLVSTTPTTVNVISSPQQQRSPELCNTEALPDEDIWALIDMPEFSWNELEKCLVSAEITYNSSNMRDPSMSLHDGPLSRDTQAVEINEPARAATKHSTCSD